MRYHVQVFIRCFVHTGLEELADGLILCSPCSSLDPSGRVTFKRNGIKRHLGSQKHLKAASHRQRIHVAHGATMSQRDLSTAALTQPGGLDHNHAVPLALAEDAFDPFAGVQNYSGHLYNHEGEKIHLSAGEIQAESERVQLLRRIEDFGIMSGVLEEYFQDVHFGENLDDDASVAHLAGQLENLGNACSMYDSSMLIQGLLFCSDMNTETDNELEEDETEAMDSGSSNPWFPHGSKAVSADMR